MIGRTSASSTSGLAAVAGSEGATGDGRGRPPGGRERADARWPEVEGIVWVPGGS